MIRVLNLADAQRGTSYTEVLAAVILIALTVVPATDAIRGAMQSAAADTTATANQFRLMSKMEEVLAEPFDDLVAAAAGRTNTTVYSDDPDSIDRRVVYISQYDGDNADNDDDPFTDTDQDLLWVKVEIEGTPRYLEALHTNE